MIQTETTVALRVPVTVLNLLIAKCQQIKVKDMGGRFNQPNAGSGPAGTAPGESRSSRLPKKYDGDQLRASGKPYNFPVGFDLRTEKFSGDFPKSCFGRFNQKFAK